jgi:hypothetical protein
MVALTIPDSDVAFVIAIHKSLARTSSSAIIENTSLIHRASL